MPLDPQVESLLAEMEAAGAEPFETMTVPQARIAAMAFAGLGGEPEPVAAVEHRFIPGPSADIPVRIYRPDGAGRLPALVYFHGSGWVVLNIEASDPTVRALVNRTGCAVVAVNYQKAPEHKFPVPFEDAWAATSWVADNAADLGLDPARIGVAGDSAGGNLAAAVTIRARDRGGPALACQVLVYPVTDYGWDSPSYLANGEGYLLQRETMRWFWSHYLTGPEDGDDPRASPLRAPDLAGLPPALVVTAEFDPLLDDGRRYARRLAESGVPVRYACYEGQVHGFLFMAGVLDAARRLHADIGEWVRTAMAETGIGGAPVGAD